MEIQPAIPPEAFEAIIATCLQHVRTRRRS
jgi:hypothetical protein